MGRTGDGILPVWCVTMVKEKAKGGRLQNENTRRQFTRDIRTASLVVPTTWPAAIDWYRRAFV